MDGCARKRGDGWVYHMGVSLRKEEWEGSEEEDIYYIEMKIYI